MSEVENFVNKKLLSFYNSNIKPYDEIFPASTLRNIWEDKVKAIIRSAIQDAYMAGIGIVGDEINAKVDFDTFISATDAKNMSDLTEELNDDFWKMTDRLVQRENEFVLQGTELVHKTSFQIDAAIAGISSIIAGRPLNTAILSKFGEAIEFLNATTGEIPTEFGEFGVEPTDVFNLDLTQLGGKIMFLTKEDQKVDEDICEPLNRTEYEVTDPTIPLPPLHRYCRCRLVPLLIGESAEEFVIE